MFDCRKPGAYDAWVSYGQSKLANILFTYELARRLPANVTANTLHPGIVATELGRYILPGSNSWWQNAVVNGLKMFAKTPSQGAETSIFLASSPSVSRLTGRVRWKARCVERVVQIVLHCTMMMMVIVLTLTNRVYSGSEVLFFYFFISSFNSTSLTASSSLQATAHTTRAMRSGSGT